MVQSGDTAFEMYMLGYDGSTDRHLALISAYVDGTPGANDMPGRIEFHTQPDGSGATLEGTTPEMVIKNDGKVGIGTASPGAKLDVNGDLNVSGTGSISQTAAASKNFFAGPVQQGYAGASSYQGYYSALTDTTVTNDYKYFHQYYLSVTPTADHAGGSATRGVAAFQMETGTNKNMTTLLPISAYGRHGGTGTLSNLVGVSAYTLNDSTGTVSSLRGLEGQTVVNSGTVTDAIGAKVSAETNGGTTSRLIGLQIYDLARNAGTLTNRYGIRIESFTGTAATDDYGIYQAGASQKNYFAGSLSVGTLNAATATHVCIDGTNTLSSCSSSIRYKDHIENLDLGLTDILKLRPVTFKWKNTGEKDLGFVAEEVEKVDPIMATYKDGRIQGVKYDQIVAPIVNAIKELYVMIKNLDSNDEKQNRETVILMQKMNLLETENAQLKNEVKAHQRELDTIKDELLQMKQLLKGRP